MIRQVPVTMVAGAPGSDDTWLVDWVRSLSDAMALPVVRSQARVIVRN